MKEIISQASVNDLPDIMTMIKACIKNMNENGITQWNEQYPPRKIFLQDIENKSLFKFAINSNLVGIIVLSPVQDEEYEDIAWNDQNGKYLVVHRMAVHPNWQRRGIASKLLDFAEKFAKEQRYTSIRIDTFSKNPRTLSLFSKRNFERKAGEIHFPENIEPYYCYELLL